MFIKSIRRILEKNKVKKGEKSNSKVDKGL